MSFETDHDLDWSLEEAAEPSAPECSALFGPFDELTEEDDTWRAYLEAALEPRRPRFRVAGTMPPPPPGVVPIAAMFGSDERMAPFLRSVELARSACPIARSDFARGGRLAHLVARDDDFSLLDGAARFWSRLFK